MTPTQTQAKKSSGTTAKKSSGGSTASKRASKQQRLYDDYRAGRLSTSQAVENLLAIASGNTDDVYADEAKGND